MRDVITTLLEVAGGLMLAAAVFLALTQVSLIAALVGTGVLLLAESALVAALTVPANVEADQ